MIEQTNFDLSNFQSEVIHEHNTLKKMKEVISQYSEKPFGRFTIDSNKQNSWTDLIWTRVFKVIGILEKKALKEFSQKADVIEYTLKSKHIVFHPKIQQILCPYLNREIDKNLLNEEKEIKVIKIITLLLTEESIVKEFTIDLDAKLFAFMAYNILQEDVGMYCQEL